MSSATCYLLDYISGSIPDWVCGSLYRNGPGLYEIGEHEFSHLFDPMAMFQRFHIGKYTFQNIIKIIGKCSTCIPYAAFERRVMNIRQNVSSLKRVLTNMEPLEHGHGVK